MKKFLIPFVIMLACKCYSQKKVVRYETHYSVDNNIILLFF